MNTLEKADMRVRWLVRRDLPAVLQIERESFDRPWTEGDFLDHLRHRYVIGAVAELGEGVAGFVVYEVAEVGLHVLNIAVAPCWRRRGVGARLMAGLTGKLWEGGRTRVTLEVCEDNLAAQLFLKSQGFRAVAVLRDYYADRPEAAYLMEFAL